MAIGNPVSTTSSSVASKTSSVIATAGQTLFTVPAGYVTNHISVFRNGIRLVDGRDYEARNGATVTLLAAATVGDVIEFHVFDTFSVADAVTNQGGTIFGDLTVEGSIGNITGVAATFTGAVSVGGVLTYEDVTNIDSVGIITARSDLSIADKIIHTGDTNTAIRFPAADTITAETGGSERLRITSAGILQLDNGNQITAADTTTYLGLGGGNSTSNGANVFLYGGSHASNASAFVLRTSTTERLRIDSSGRMGLGTASPGSFNANLAVFSTGGAFVGAFHSNVSGTFPKASAISFGSDAVSYTYTTNGSTVALRGSAHIAALQSAGSGATTDLAFFTTASGSVSEKMRLDSSGRLLIGKTSGAYQIDIGGVSNAQIRCDGATTQGQRGLIYAYNGTNYGSTGLNVHTGELRIRSGELGQGGYFITLGTGGVEAMRIDSSKRVLVGTTAAPTGSSTTYAKLVLRGNTVNSNEAYFALGRGSAAVSGQSLGSLWFIDNADGQFARIDAHCDGTPGASDFPGRLSFWTTADGASSPTERLRIDSSGRLLVQSSSTPTQGLYSQYAPLTIQGYIGSTAGNGILNVARGTTASNLSINSDIGTVVFSDSAGGEFGRISCFADAAPGSNDYPGRIVLATTADGASLPTERLRIDSSGKVGIGLFTTSPLVSSPWTNLQVNGANVASPVSARNSNTPPSNLHVSTNSYGVNQGGSISFGSQPDNVNDYAAYASVAGRRDSSLGYVYSGYLQFNTSDGSNLNERMRITSSGQMGLGTNNPVQQSGIGLHINNASGQARLKLTSSSTGATANDGVDLIVETNSEVHLLNHEAAALKFGTSDVEKMRIDSSGRLLVGRTTSGNVGSGAASSVQIQNAIGFHIGCVATQDSGGAGGIAIGKSRNGGIVQSGDDLGSIVFAGHDGVDLQTRAASIEVEVDGTPGSNDMPGRMLFKTTADGSNSPTERMRIDSSGQLLVGETASGGACKLGMSFGNATGNYMELGGTQRSANGLNKIFVFRHGYWGGSQEVASMGVLTNSSSGGAGTGYAALTFQTGTSGNGDGGSTSTERMRITNGGEVMMGTTSRLDSNPVRLTVRGPFPTTPIEVQQDTSNTHYMMTFRNSNGLVGHITATGSSCSFTNASDYRLKENVVSINDGITRVKQLQPKRFNFIADADTTVDGFLAHEAQSVVPESVIGTKDQVEVWRETDELPEGVSVGDNKLDDEGNTIPVMQGIDTSKLIPLLTAALQEAIAKIETLETANADLVARVTALEG